MKNTLIPLDMLFFDAAGRLTRVHANAVPLDETPIPGGDNVRYVLEINGGAGRRRSASSPGPSCAIRRSTRRAAAWPCE